MSYNNDLGKFGEDIAKKYLIHKGFTFLSENYFTRYGEIDLIFKKEQFLVFVEVKTRKNKHHFETAIGHKKVQNLYASAEIFIENENISFCEMRFDIILIYIDQRGKVVEIGHRPNFF